MSKNSNFHEEYNYHDELNIGSNKSFGLVFGVFFVIVGFLTSQKLAVAFFVFAGLFFLISYLAPAILAPLNKIWFKFGVLLSKVISPVILSVLFFLVFTPMAFFFKIMGKDPLRLKIDKEKKSYWIKRNKEENNPKSMINQF